VPVGRSEREGHNAEGYVHTTRVAHHGSGPVAHLPGAMILLTRPLVDLCGISPPDVADSHAEVRGSGHHGPHLMTLRARSLPIHMWALPDETAGGRQRSGWPPARHQHRTWA